MTYQWSFNLLLWSSCTVYTLDMFFSMGLRLLLFMLDMHLYLFWRDMHAYCIVSDPGKFWLVVIIYQEIFCFRFFSNFEQKSLCGIEHWTLNIVNIFCRFISRFWCSLSPLDRQSRISSSSFSDKVLAPFYRLLQRECWAASRATALLAPSARIRC